MALGYAAKRAVACKRSFFLFGLGGLLTGSRHGFARREPGAAGRADSPGIWHNDAQHSIILLFFFLVSS